MYRLLPVLCFLCCEMAAFAEQLDYQVLDSELKVVRLDSSPDDSFLSVRLDTTGRIFVGGRKTLYVYDLDTSGKYQPRHLLFEFPDHSWVNDIEILGDDLYVVTVSAVYRLPGARVKRQGLTIERLLWGVPNGHVHQCLHACAWGPEGDLYVSMGDPLWYYGDFSRPDHWGHWTMFFKPSSELEAKNSGGEKIVQVGETKWAAVPYNGVGAVFRIRPDGTKLRSFARGLRNSCGLCFDKNWNLFTNDNDHEGLPSMYAPGRLLHVTEDAYFSWPRGWLKSKTPDRADLMPTVNEEMGRAVPVLQTYYGDGYLPPKYDNSLMVARWCRRQIAYFPLEQQGKTFTAKEHVLLEGRDQARPVGVCVGRGGRVFVTLSYMAQNEGSPTYRSDLAVITRKDDTDLMPFKSHDLTKMTSKELADVPTSEPLSIRTACYQEQLRRRIERPQSPQASSFEWNGLSFPNSESGIAQSIEANVDGFLKGLREELKKKPSKGEYETLPLLMKGAKFPLPNLTKASCRDPNVDIRMWGVLLAGFRLTIPPVDASLPENAPLAPQQKEEANIILFAGEKEPIDLRKLGRVGNYTVAEHWKAVKHSDEQEALFGLLIERLNDTDDKIRLQAAHFLSLLDDSRSEPRVLSVLTDVQDKRLNLGKLEHLKPVVWMLGPVPDANGFGSVHPIETGPVDLSAKYEIGGKSFEWKLTKTTSPDRPLYNFHTLFGPSPHSSVYSFFRFDVPTAQRMQLLVGSEDGVRIWQNGKLVFEKNVVRPLIQLDDVLSLNLQPGSNDILVRVQMRKGIGGQYLHYRHLGDVKLTIPDKPDGLSLADRLKTAGTGNQAVDPKFLEVDWVNSVKQGDAARGKKLFAAESLGCAKCHAATASQAGGGGPSLADAGKRFTVPYLVESILVPNKVISPVFKSSIIATVDGKIITGLVVVETAEKLEVLQADTKRITVLKSQIEERKLGDVSAMPHGIVKTTDELRDVVTYLLSNPVDE